MATGAHRIKLGKLGESDQRRPLPFKNSEFVVEEIPDLSFLTDKFNVKSNKTIKVNPHTLMTSMEGIFAGGDVVSGPATVIEAIAAGGTAVISIDRYLRGLSLEYEESMPHTINIKDIDITDVKKRKRQKMPDSSPKRRIQDCFKEVEPGFNEMTAQKETDRCLQCGMFPDKQKL